jgi:alpha-2-macroglobulin
VRVPFREATALVALEREGVLDAWVVPLKGREPVVEVPVRDTYAPNMFVSILAVRGRVGGIQPTALVDLGRPAFKLGIAEIRVGWRAHELKVAVTPERPVYRVRETATVRIAVKDAAGAPPPAGAEVAVAAVDEGLLELSPNPSWELLEAMMGRRGYAVQTATAQMQVVGKRHFGRKALPPGGGGGRASTRELFDTLLFWQARVTLDARGEATVRVPLNDSLTSFRLVAVATAGVGRFGSGTATIRSTQDLMVLPGIAPLVRQGDRIVSEITLRNATDRPMEVRVSGRVEGLPTPLPARTVALAGGEARVVGWEVTVPADVETLAWEIEAAAGPGQTDRVRVRQRVVPAVPVRAYQATISQWTGPLRQPVERPVDAQPGRGGVELALRASLVEGLAGVREWMRAYPYTCLEQQVSRTVALRDATRWEAIADALPAFQDEDGLLKYFPTMRWGSAVLTAYILAISHEAGWAIPDEPRGRMQDALRRFVEGSLNRWDELPTADLAIRKLAALEALSRYGAADPKLLGSVTIEPTLWPTSAVLDWRSLLHRMSGIPNRQRRLAEAEQILQARLTLSGTTMGFSTERADTLWWLMVSADVNAVRLLLHLVETGEWRDDVPRLVRGALQRQKRGAWDLTTANAWGVLAVEKFSAAYERTPVTGTTTATLGDTTRRVEWTGAAAGGTAAFPWPPGRADLTVDHAGTGRPWVTVLTRAAIPLAAPLEAGYRITKRVTPLEPRADGRLRRGDLLRVHLDIEAQTDMTWVVVHDPVPAGASHLGTGLGRDSQLATQGERWRGQAWPAFEERGFEAYRAYFAWVPKGTFTVEYTIRVNQAGRFALPTTRVEALYAPELFAESPNAAVEVSE